MVSQCRKLRLQALQLKISSKTGSNLRECDAVLEHHPAKPRESVTTVILSSCAHQDQLGCQSYKEICNDLTAIEVSKRNSLFARSGLESLNA